MKNGKYVELEKPLSQHTVGELIDLIEQGYDNFGLYDIRKEGLIQLMRDLPDLDFDAMFDERMQHILLSINRLSVLISYVPLKIWRSANKCNSF